MSMRGYGVFEAHVGKLPNRSGGEAVTAGLLTRKGLLFDETHVPTGLRQPVGAGGTARPSADNDDVVCVGRLGEFIKGSHPLRLGVTGGRSAR
jgi:hypothetical protein